MSFETHPAILNSCVTDTVHNAKPQLTALIIHAAQDNDREREP